ncbi:MAG: Fe-S cluster assembly protein SufD [Planctomycetota bacterium]|jgi:Fe-S cluster assembly protein SufD|nr:Fe-S cluster assembly protein SufD [Planctomycetota bacterium]
MTTSAPTTQPPLLEALTSAFPTEPAPLGDEVRRLLATGVPTQKHEAFRYASLRKLRSKAFDFSAPSGAVDSPDLFVCSGLENRRLVFVDGMWREELSSLQTPSQDLTWDVGPSQLATAPEHHELASSDFFENLNQLGDTPFFHLQVAEGAIIDTPIHLAFWNTSSEETYAVRRGQVRLTVGKGARISLVTSTGGQGNYLSNHHLQFELAHGAEVQHYAIQEDPEESFLFDSQHVLCSEESKYSLVAIGFGTEITRNRYRVDLLGERAIANLRGTEVLSGQREHHKVITVHHRAPHCESNQHFKTILGEKSNASYDGMIVVDQIAQKTDAFQLGANLMLSEEARIHIKPSLFIHADDVKCSHGATIGQLENEEIHYLRTRGIPHAEARRLMIYSFAAEILMEIENAPLQNQFADSFLARLIRVEDSLSPAKIS